MKPSLRKVVALSWSVPGGVRCGMWSRIFVEGPDMLEARTT